MLGTNLFHYYNGSNNTAVPTVVVLIVLVMLVASISCANTRYEGYVLGIGMISITIFVAKSTIAAVAVTVLTAYGPVRWRSQVRQVEGGKICWYFY